MTYIRLFTSFKPHDSLALGHKHPHLAGEETETQQGEAGALVPQGAGDSGDRPQAEISGRSGL